ncbi:hypothetical protein AWC17_15545 [Mycobacterium nebraskense]|uniref:Uncharacterized protein n=1 Tax=Mycobacterium nebraskense TaxID=244292 RepID=A0A1X1YYL2_9MYCO|nr:hypothetical protein AWC17_15545 [Mycobacterium nebraskense]
MLGGVGAIIITVGVIHSRLNKEINVDIEHTLHGIYATGWRQNQVGRLRAMMAAVPPPGERLKATIGDGQAQPHASPLK